MEFRLWILSFFFVMMFILAFLVLAAIYCLLAGWLTIMWKDKGMGFVLLQLQILSCIFLSFVNSGSAGVTSAFVRSEWPSTDIPLDNEAFVVPKGYNVPQQVSLHKSFWNY